MINFLQGPGQNTNYYLITTGINSDPNHGSMGFDNYDIIKQVIQQRAEIIFENDIVRKFAGLTTNTFLKGYDDTPRIIYQVLIGTARYSDPWSCDELQDAIEEFPRDSNKIPKNNEYSIDFIASLENGMKVNQAVLAPTLQWIQNDDFFYSSILPSIGIGDAGDVWFVSNNNQFEMHYRPAFSWTTITEYINMVSPIGKLFISTVAPVEQLNSWWLDPTGIVIRKYSTTINNWEAPSSITVSEIEPTTPNNGDLWLNPIFGRMKLFVFNGVRFVSATISEHPVRDVLSNSSYVGDLTKNNYLVECGDVALLGGVLSNIGESLMIKVYDEGVLVGEFDSINFLGSGVSVINNIGTGRADVTVTTTDGDTVFSFNDTIITNNETIIQLPAQTITIIEFAVNGVETTAFTFSLATKQITFDPIQANYTLEIDDKIHVIFKDV